MNREKENVCCLQAGLSEVFLMFKARLLSFSCNYRDAHISVLLPES